MVEKTIEKNLSSILSNDYVLEVNSGTAGIIITVSFFSGIILLTLGITGIYIARIFEEVRGRDRYIIKEIKKKN